MSLQPTCTTTSWAKGVFGEDSGKLFQDVRNLSTRKTKRGCIILFHIPHDGVTNDDDGDRVDGESRTERLAGARLGAGVKSRVEQRVLF